MSDLSNLSLMDMGNGLMADLIRINAGCGYRKIEGWLNVDCDEKCEPDQVAMLDGDEWFFVENDSVDEVLFNHSLEHMGEDALSFMSLMQEVYQKCKAGAIVTINTPHPRHDDFLNDFTHVRAITPTALGLLSRKANAYFREMNAANSCLADAWDVDFEITKVEAILDPRFAHLQGQDASRERLEATQNNIIKEYHIEMRVVK